jgi:hypothetical protein
VDSLNKPQINLRVLATLTGCGTLGVLAVFPYLMTLEGNIIKNLPLPLGLLILIQLAQGALLLAGFTYAGLYLGAELDLGVPVLTRWFAKTSLTIDWRRYLLQTVGLGVLAGLLIIVCSYAFLFFGPKTTAQVTTPAWWKGLLAAVYGGFTEEIELRLFLMTTLVWITAKFTGTLHSKPHFIYWTGLFLAAIIFGVGHLPAAATIYHRLTGFLTFQIIFLNAIGGVI